LLAEESGGAHRIVCNLPSMLGRVPGYPVSVLRSNQNGRGLCHSERERYLITNADGFANPVCPTH
jgi:hypothetical protein